MPSKAVPASFPHHHTLLWVGPSSITFVVGWGVGVYDAAACGTAVLAPPLLYACTRRCVLVRVRSSSD